MTKRIATTMLAGLLTASFGWAQTTTKADIPFGFLVGNKLMPPGHYVIKAHTGYVSLQSALGESVVGLTHADQRKEEGPPKLIFTRYGGETFLSRVYTTYSTAGAAFSQSKREKELAKAIQRQESTSIALANTR